MPTREDLQILQAQDLELKIMLTKQRIREWVTAFSSSGVYVSFSGGKDSTVLLHLVREVYPDVEAVFVNTGLEYPEIQRFVKTFDNVRILYPKKTFKQVICEYGYPVISKEVSSCVYEVRKYGDSAKIKKEKLFGTFKDKNGNKSIYCVEKYKPLLYMDFWTSNRCCNVMKKAPLHIYGRETDKKPIIATMTEEGRMRESSWLKTGCNAFDSKYQMSKPMSFWTNQDVLQYIKENNIKIPSVYGDICADKDGQLAFDDCACKLYTTGCDRTGCIFCGFGAHLEKGESRFESLKRTHPKQYDFCINGGAYDDDGIWKPDSKGLGMGHVFDELNKLYGDDFIRY